MQQSDRSEVTTYGSMPPATSMVPHEDDALLLYDSVPSTADTTTTITKRYRVYFQRWVVLCAFSFLSFVNNWLWITWSPFTLPLAEYWGVPSAWVNDLSAVYMYVYIPLSFPALSVPFERLQVAHGTAPGRRMECGRCRHAVLGHVVLPVGLCRHGGMCHVSNLDAGHATPH